MTALFHELRTPLLRYTLSLGLPLADGEDVVQEVFLALFRHLRQGKARGNLRGWIFRTGHNQALKRRMHLARADVLPQNATLQDPLPNPEELAGHTRRQAHVAAVIRALPDRDRWCLHLRAEGLRYREIAEALEMSLGAVAQSLSRSLGRLSSAGERLHGK